MLNWVIAFEDLADSRGFRLPSPSVKRISTECKQSANFLVAIKKQHIPSKAARWVYAHRNHSAVLGDFRFLIGSDIVIVCTGIGSDIVIVCTGDHLEHNYNPSNYFQYCSKESRPKVTIICERDNLYSLCSVQDRLLPIYVREGQKACPFSSSLRSGL